MGYLLGDDELRGIRVSEEALDKEDALPMYLTQDISRLLDRHGRKSASQLVEYVYPRFPWYTVNSSRPMDMIPQIDPQVFLVGYEGLQVDDLLDLLLRNGIRIVADIRSNPVSRRFGFHGSTLKRLCGKLDIEYVHMPELGIPSASRRGAVTDDDFQLLFEFYEETTLQVETDSLRLLSGLIRTKPCALLCMEEEPVSCHRFRVGRKLSDNCGLPMRDLRCRLPSQTTGLRRKS
jgi:uncharacterized protein (DUF488 family)